MSFSRFNILANFQDYINKIFVKRLDIFIVVYLDDILISIEDSRQSYVEAMRWVSK